MSMNRLRLFLTLLVELLKLVDCLFNVCLGVVLLAWALITGQEGEGSFAGETLSARAGRARMNGKAWGALVPLIDVLFLWQSDVLEFEDGSTFQHPSHCARAFLKKYHKIDMPREYRCALPAEYRA
jgi:hypothetical protein